MSVILKNMHMKVSMSRGEHRSRTPVRISRCRGVQRHRITDRPLVSRPNYTVGSA
jgi:hypothetical protein